MICFSLTKDPEGFYSSYGSNLPEVKFTNIYLHLSKYDIIFCLLFICLGLHSLLLKLVIVVPINSPEA